MENLVIQPNASLTQRGKIIFLLLLSSTIMIIAVSFAFLGLWLILPFAGLEVLGLLLAFYCCNYKEKYRETVSISDAEVIVTTGHGKPQNSCVFQKLWTSVLLQAPGRRGHPSRLLLRSRGKEVEIGVCLTKRDKQALWMQLRQAVENR